MSTTEILEFPRPVTPEGKPDPLLLDMIRDNPLLPVVGPGGTRAWLVGSDALAREVLSDPSRFSNMIDPAATNSRANMVVIDPPHHTRLRKLAAQAFTPRRVRVLVPDIEDLVSSLLDEMAAAGSPLDLVEALAMPLPTRVICRLLGVPQEDQKHLRHWSHVFTAMTAYTSDEIGAAVDQMYAYMHRLVAERRDDLGEDVLSYLIRARDGQDALTEDELVATVVLLLVAGNETTLKAITRGVMALLDTGQWSRLASGEVDAGQVADEVLRHQTPIDTGLFRWAKVDMDVAGHHIAAGEQIFVSLHLANFDPAARADASTFDPGRESVPHLAFGHGTHFCLGSPLARAELAAAFGQLAARFPTLRLEKPISELTWTVGSMLNAPTSVPVAW
ncbi:cytochrome P450 [Actinokineospora sp.]|uniref:cytochrome P450 n=1 Tax=Actinokineospora sp. TaxID=1872133 RepID=UPI0040378007